MVQYNCSTIHTFDRTQHGTFLAVVENRFNCVEWNLEKKPLFNFTAVVNIDVTVNVQSTRHRNES